MKWKRIRNPVSYLSLLCRLPTYSLWAVAAVPAAGSVCPRLQPWVTAPPGLSAQSHPQAVLQVSNQEPKFVYISRHKLLFSLDRYYMSLLAINDLWTSWLFKHVLRIFYYYQCSGSVCFWDSWIRILSSANKKFIKPWFFLGFLKITDEKSRIRSRMRIRKSSVQIQGSGPYQDVTDPEHWLFYMFLKSCLYTSFMSCYLTGSCSFVHFWSFDLQRFLAVLRIRDILVRFRVRILLFSSVTYKMVDGK
jgi:hypothetical protein